MRLLSTFLLGSVLAAASLGAQGVQVVDLGGGLYQAVGAGIQGGSGVRVPQSNTFLIATTGGNVIVDTSIAAAARAHKDALVALQKGPIHSIILTHAHGDHTGGIATWREPATKVIVHRLWFDGNVSTMFGSASQAYGDIVTLAGGPDAVAARALALAPTDPMRALYLTDMSLAADPRHKPSLLARIAALRTLDTQSNNSNERGWLAAGIREAESRLK